MKIKQTRQVRLDELLKYVWDNQITFENFCLHNPNENEKDEFISIDTLGDFDLGNMDYVTKKNLFTITEEVEITEDTPLQRAMVINNNLDFYPIKNRKINGLKTTNIKFIYLQNSDGSIGDLIWDKERGLID